MNSSFTPIRILVADDHAIFRRGFIIILNSHTEMNVVGQAGNGKELVELAAHLKPDIVITDIQMTGTDGIEATKILTEKYPEINVIGLSAFDNEKAVMQIMQAGAKGFLLKSMEETEIVDAINRVHRNEVYLPRQVSDNIAKLVVKNKINPYNGQIRNSFKEKEIEVIRLICQEYSNKEISEKLHSSIRTVEGYRKKIVQKMRVKNCAGIVVYAIKNKIYEVGLDAILFFILFKNEELFQNL